MVIWMTGLSGSGKTTLCQALFQLLKPKLPQLVLLDGDALREAFGNDLGYCESDRIRQVTRVQKIVKLLSDQGLIVMVAVLYSNPALLAWNRENIRGYFEIYMDAPLDFLRRRDAKGLYARAERGQAAEIVGLDIPWCPPLAADLVIEAESAPSPDVLARTVAKAIPFLPVAV